MKIHDVEIGSEEWKALRREKITATDTPKILLGRFGTGLDVCIDKWGEATEAAISPAMRRGLVLEEPVALAYTKRTGRELRPGCFAEHSEYPWFAATPDRFIAGNGGIVQIKTHLDWLKSDYGEDGSSVFPEAELVQVLHEMEVTGADYADLVPLFGSEAAFDLLVYMLDAGKMTEAEVANYIAEKMDLRVFRIARDEALQADIVAAAKEFREKYVIPHEIPPDAPTFQNKDKIRKATEEEARLVQMTKAMWLEKESADKFYDDIKEAAKRAIGEDKGIDAGDGDKITFSKSKDTVENVVDWEGVAKEVDASPKEIARASKTVTDWEEVAKTSAASWRIAKEKWNGLVAKYTEVRVIKRGVRTFRVPHLKWKVEI